MTTGRTALPGGAPLKKKPRKRSAAKSASSKGKSKRSSAGSKKAKKAATSTVARSAAARKPSAKGKPACKYGPRLANGRCPTKPKKSQQLKRDVETIFKPTATAAQKKESATRIADAVATQVGKDVGASVQRSLKRKDTQEQLKKLAPAAGALLKASVPVLGSAGALGAGFYLGDKAIKKMAEDRVRSAEKALVKQYPQGFPLDMRNTLLKQHYDAIRKEGVIAPSKSLPTLR